MNDTYMDRAGSETGMIWEPSAMAAYMELKNDRSDKWSVYETVK